MLTIPLILNLLGIFFPRNHLKGVGTGVFEIVTRFDSDTYRTVYAVQIGQHIYVLHAFQKKSPKGIKTAQKDVDLIKSRYKQAIEQSKRQG